MSYEHSLTAEETHEAQTPAWARVKAPEACRPFLGKYGLPEPFCSKKGPLGAKVTGVDRWQANHFIVCRPETAAILYGDYTPVPVAYRQGALPLFEEAAARYAAGLASHEDLATAFVTRALPELCGHPTIPPVAPHCRTDRGLLDEPLLASGRGFCNEQARVFVRLCQTRGIQARMVFLFYADKATGHTTAEFWTGEKWAMVDVSWHLVFPGPDGRLMSAGECHGDQRQRLCMAVAYQARMRQIVAMDDETLCGRAFPAGTRDRETAVRAKAAELRDYVRVRMPMERLTGHLWQFGILDYPLPE